MFVALCGLIFVMAGLVKGLLGMGLPTLAMALLVILMPSPEAAALLLLPSVLTNLWQMGARRRHCGCAGGCCRCWRASPWRPWSPRAG